MQLTLLLVVLKFVESVILLVVVCVYVRWGLEMSNCLYGLERKVVDAIALLVRRAEGIVSRGALRLMINSDNVSDFLDEQHYKLVSVRAK